MSENTKKPFEPTHYLNLGGGVFRTSYAVYDVHGKERRREIEIPRQVILARKQKLYEEWQAEGRTDFRGVLNRATTLVVREAIENKTKTVVKKGKG
jgi:hypothetical protein